MAVARNYDASAHAMGQRAGAQLGKELWDLGDLVERMLTDSPSRAASRRAAATCARIAANPPLHGMLGEARLPTLPTCGAAASA